MNTARAVTRFTEEQYIAFESADVEKHEFFDGHILAMAGASSRHIDVCANVQGLLRASVRSCGCRELGPDQRLYIEASGVYTYADVSVVCGPRVERRLRGKVTATTNPSVIVEVLSETTRDYDCGEKLAMYKTIPSVTDILLVDHEALTITRWTRTARGFSSKTWSKGSVPLASVGASLPVEDVFRDIAESDE